jgi:predicted ribosomally synthesized peptide with nif11-like leader
MSIESAKALYNRLLNDEEFRTQIDGIEGEEERRQFLYTAGYEYTPEELEAAKTELLESISSNEELSDRELEEVAGGAGKSTDWNDLIDLLDKPLPMALYGGPGLWDK